MEEQLGGDGPHGEFATEEVPELDAGGAVGAFDARSTAVVAVAGHGVRCRACSLQAQGHGAAASLSSEASREPSKPRWPWRRIQPRTLEAGEAASSGPPVGSPAALDEPEPSSRWPRQARPANLASRAWPCKRSQPAQPRASAIFAAREQVKPPAAPEAPHFRFFRFRWFAGAGVVLLVIPVHAEEPGEGAWAEVASQAVAA